MCQALKGAGILIGVLLCSSEHQSLKGAPWVGSFSVVQCIRHLMSQPIVQLPIHPLHMTQQYHLASMAAWLSATGISHHNLLPHIPLIHLSAVNSSPHPGITPQPLNSSSQTLHLPRDLHSCPGYVWLRQGLILIPFRLPQISCFTLSLKRFSSDSDNCPDVGIRPLLPFPYPSRVGPVLISLLFFPLVPSSYQVLCGSMYSFAWK